MYPEVPWTAAARMRDRLIHHYVDIDLDILWATVSEDLPQLLKVLPRQPSKAGYAPVLTVILSSCSELPS
jgi:uncharacterized protein with HEPN domain